MNIQEEIREILITPSPAMIKTRDMVIQGVSSTDLSYKTTKLANLIAIKELEASDKELFKAFTEVVGDKSVSLRSKFVKRFDTYLKLRHTDLEQQLLKLKEKS